MTEFRLPMRVAFHGTEKPPRHAIAGTPGSRGDAGWTVVRFPSVEAARNAMLDYPQARMPCWRRVEARKS